MPDLDEQPNMNFKGHSRKLAIAYVVVKAPAWLSSGVKSRCCQSMALAPLPVASDSGGRVVFEFVSAASESIGVTPEGPPVSFEVLTEVAAIPWWVVDSLTLEREGVPSNAKNGSSFLSPSFHLSKRYPEVRLMGPSRLSDPSLDDTAMVSTGRNDVTTIDTYWSG